MQTLGTGTIVGEIEFYTQSPYQKTAIVDQDSKLYQLIISDLHKMQDNHPKTAYIFSKFINSPLSKQISKSEKEIENLPL